MAEENENVIDQAQSPEEGGQQASEQQAQGQPAGEQKREEPQRNVDSISVEERASQIDYILAAAEKDPSIKELPEYQAMIAELESIDKSKTQATGNEDGNGTDPKKGEEGKSSEEEEEEEEQEEEEDEFENLSDEDDVFGLKSKKKTKYKFKDEKDVTEFMKKRYAVKDYPKFFESVDKWRNDSQNLVQIQEVQNQLLEGLGSLPQPIKNAIQAFAEADDWRAAFQNSTTNLSFDTDFNSVDKEEVVKHYFKDKYEKLKSKLDNESIDEEEFEERITDFYESSQKLFESDKKAIEQKRAELEKTENARQEALTNSISSSVKALKEEFPNFNQSQLQKVRQVLVNGIESLYMTDGIYNADAAEKIAYALFGKNIIKAKTSAAKRAGKNESKQEFFERGNKQIRTTESQQGYNGKRAEEAVQHLKGQFKKSTYS